MNNFPTIVLQDVEFSFAIGIRGRTTVQPSAGVSCSAFQSCSQLSASQPSTPNPEPVLLAFLQLITKYRGLSELFCRSLSRDGAGSERARFNQLYLGRNQTDVPQPWFRVRTWTVLLCIKRDQNVAAGINPRSRPHPISTIRGINFDFRLESEATNGVLIFTRHFQMKNGQLVWFNSILAPIE